MFYIVPVYPSEFVYTFSLNQPMYTVDVQGSARPYYQCEGIIQTNYGRPQTAEYRYKIIQ